MNEYLTTESGQCEYKGKESFMNCKGKFKVLPGVSCDNKCRMCNAKLVVKKETK